MTYPMVPKVPRGTHLSPPPPPEVLSAPPPPPRSSGVASAPPGMLVVKDGKLIPDWTNQKQFVVVEEMLRLKWSGRGRRSFACGLCNHFFETGDKARWFMSRIGANPFVCESCDGPDVHERWEKYWREVIKPVLDRWGNW